MNYYILAIEAVVLVIIFTFMIIVPLCKNPVWWIHDYPKDIQEEYFKTHERIPAAPLSKPALVKKGFAYGVLGTEEMKERIRGWADRYL